MNRLIRFVFFASYLLWGALILYAGFMLIFYNAHYDFFDYKCQDIDSFQVNESYKEGKLEIKYSFDVGGKTYYESDSFFKEIFKQRIGDNSTKMTVCYNLSFPTFNYLKDINFKGRYHNTGLLIGGFFFFLTVIFDLFGNKKRMTEKYRKAFTGGPAKS